MIILPLKVWILLATTIDQQYEIFSNKIFLSADFDYS